MCCAGPSRSTSVAAAVPVRRRAAGGLEFLLVRTSNGERWTFPKGGVERGESMSQAAAREAREEAGVTGLVGSEPLGDLPLRAVAQRVAMSIPMTIGIGLAGSFVGGLIGRALFGDGGGSLLLSIICAAAIVYFIRRSRGGGLTDPGAPPGY